MEAYHTTMPETKSAKNWTITFLPSSNDYSPVAGVLEIGSSRGRATYCVTEFAVGFDGRGFNLGKIGDDVRVEENYAVFCGRRPGADTCECRGWVATGGCKHLRAVRDLVNAGQL